MAEADRLQWETSVPIFRNAMILRQMAIAIDIPLSSPSCANWEGELYCSRGSS